MNPYCTLQLESQTHQTRVLTKTTAPRWDQTFTLFVSSEHATLEVIVWDSIGIGKPGFRGRCIVPLAEISKDTPSTGWHKLTSLRPEKEKDHGDISLTILFLKT
eukprot:TRINITY_DN1845_c0_g1_i1.p1 TRINITY_DN1845_c0_g1~~TRINITY_DN1845_c0_g1_i1.p1  ORF type:complete len:104 (-),score=17.15 TRINITY_DN1845_c0_g1_i1:36-347(-)